MTDLEQHFRTLDRLDAPDLWPEAERRSPGSRSGPRRPHRLATAVLAITVGAAGIGFAIWAFRERPQLPTPRPAATVDNGQIAYVRRAEKDTITLVDPGGANLSPLIEGSDPAWSPDGRTLAFVTSASDEKPSISTVSADGSDLTPVFQFQGQPGSIGPQAWSPDGSQLVFGSFDGIYVMNVDGTGVRRVARYEGEHACYDVDPSWSPDGSTIVFAVLCEGGNEGLWTVAVDGSNLRQLIGGEYEVDEYRSPVWSPDGTKVAFVKTDWTLDDPIKQATIQMVNADGSGLTRLVTGVGFDRSFAWSPDGRALAFTRYHEGGSDIFLLNLQSGEVSQLTHSGDAVDPAWQPIPMDGETASLTRCVQATTSGDFDGDGATDEAEFIELVTGSISCNRDGEVIENLSSQEVLIRFGSGQIVKQAFADCQGGLCAYVFSATDLDGDGSDELAVDVSSAAATGLVELYRVDPDGIRALVIADPGDPPYVQPGPAILGGGFDSGLQSPIICRVNEDGTRELVSIHAENVGDSLSGPWRVHTSTMVLQGDRLVVTSTDDSESRFPGTSGIPSFSKTSPFENGCS
jgi:Tol biopolymer transport system component